jgi:hypothetical protein
VDVFGVLLTLEHARKHAGVLDADHFLDSYSVSLVVLRTPYSGQERLRRCQGSKTDTVNHKGYVVS